MTVLASQTFRSSETQLFTEDLRHLHLVKVREPSHPPILVRAASSIASTDVYPHKVWYCCIVSCVVRRVDTRHKRVPLLTVDHEAAKKPY